MYRRLGMSVGAIVEGESGSQYPVVVSAVDVILGLYITRKIDE